MPLERIEVTGAREFRRELKKLDHPALTNDLKDVNFRVAEHVRVAAVAKASGQGRMVERAAGTLRASRVATRAALMLGNKATPFAAGAEFGAAQNKLRSTARGPRLGWNQFEPWRGAGRSAGYFVYPAIRQETTQIVEMYGDEIQRLANKAFPD